MPIKIDTTEQEIKARFLKASRFIIADFDKWGIKNQSEFAASIGWRDSNLSRAINNTDICIPARYLNKIVVKFGLDADWLLTGAGEMLFKSRGVIVSNKRISIPAASSREKKVLR